MTSVDLDVIVRLAFLLAIIVSICCTEGHINNIFAKFSYILYLSERKKFINWLLYVVKNLYFYLFSLQMNSSMPVLETMCFHHAYKLMKVKEITYQYSCHKVHLDIVM